MSLDGDTVYPVDCGRKKYENGTLCATSWFNGATSPALPTFMRWMAGTPGFRLFDGMLYGKATGDLLSVSMGLVKSLTTLCVLKPA